ncbi:MAG: hypothetical protein MJZ32_11580 [Bacteroidaceae bacterium]|nr:hypothetical protein [Bacteroidaceae bacterium]
MKKILFTLLSIIAFVAMTNAQSMKVYQDGQLKAIYYVSKDDKVEFSDDFPFPENNNMVNGHEFVDLGLSVKWATCNVGAKKPEEAGGYYAWGETHEHRNADGSYNMYILSSYNGSYFYAGDEGYQYISKDGKMTYIGKEISGQREYDVATLTMGNNWRMPTYEEIQELLNNTTSIWTNNYKGSGIAGRIYTSTKRGYTNASIFFPAAGYRNINTPSGYNSEGKYWSGTLCDIANYDKAPNRAYTLSFDSKNAQEPIFYYPERFFGCSIRPVFIGSNSQ